MFRIYICLSNNQELNDKIKLAIEQEYPYLVFDTDVVYGETGVRVHRSTYDLDSPMMKELRAFCLGYELCWRREKKLSRRVQENVNESS